MVCYNGDNKKKGFAVAKLVSLLRNKQTQSLKQIAKLFYRVFV